MKKLLVVMCIYNEFEVMRRSVESVLKNTTGEFDCVMVYNHPPEQPKLLEWLGKCRSNYYIDNPGTPNVINILDPGCNMGCHGGFNYAVDNMNNIVKKLGYEFIAKVDDDTIVPKGWNEPMMKVIKLDYDIGYIASINQSDRQGANCKKKKVHEYHLEIPRQGAVSFSCVMFHHKVLERVGLLSTDNVVRVNKKVCPDDNLFGGEEINYQRRIRQRGKYGAYITDMIALHVGHEERKDVDYMLWKVWYGYLGKTQEDYPAFKKNRLQLTEAYRAALGFDYDWWKINAIKKLIEFNCRDALPMIKDIKTKNPEIRKLKAVAAKQLKTPVCKQMVARIKQRRQAWKTKRMLKEKLGKITTN